VLLLLPLLSVDSEPDAVAYDYIYTKAPHAHAWVAGRGKYCFTFVQQETQLKKQDPEAQWQSS
jgi:hypothetical protein